MNNFLDKLKKEIPVPKMIRFDHAGIDIGSDHIRHISFKRQGGKTLIDKYGTEILEKTFNKKTLLSENVYMIDILRKIQKEYKYKYVEVSLPEELAYIYTQEVLDGDIEKIRSQIEFKIEENVPMKSDEVIFDFASVVLLKNGNRLVSVSVVSKKAIDDYTDAFEKANMKIVSFMVQNQALSKSLIGKNDINAYCIVAIEKKSIVVSIVSCGMVLYTSTINKTLFDDNLNLERKEILEEVIKDIYKIIIFWISYIEENESYGFDKIKSIIISSTHSNIIESEFINMMTNKLALQIEKPNVWINTFDFKDEIPTIDKIESYQYATSIGLALPKLK